MLPVQNTPLYTVVAERLVELIKGGTWPDNVLPSEEQLGKILRVSKPTLREALAELTSQGIISKKHGLGNIVIPSAVEARFRFDLKLDFVDMLSTEGYDVSLFQSYHRFEVLAEEAVPQGTYFIYDEFVMADLRPAIKLTMHIPQHMFNQEVPSGLRIGNMFSFIYDYTGEVINHSIVNVVPALAGDSLARIFAMGREEPVVSWRETFHNLQDKKLCFTRIYFNPKIMGLTMLRKGSYPHEIGCPVVVCADLEESVLEVAQSES